MTTAVTSELPNFIGDLDIAAARKVLESRHSLVTFSCDDEQKFLDAAHELGEVLLHRDSDERGITAIKEIAGEVQVGLTKQELLFHTDCPAIPAPPRWIMILCRESDGQGGETFACLGDDVVEHLRQKDPAALAALTAPEAAIFRTGPDTRICPIIELDADEAAQVRLRFDRHVHFSWDVTRHVDAILTGMRAVSWRFALTPGMGYIIDNTKWFHGRTAYRGAREASRIHVGPRAENG